jgi:hypothetical protein
MSERKRTMNDAAILAERIRKACIEAAKKAHEDTGISGLCAEGRWECALQAIRSADLNAPVQDISSAEGEMDI